MELKVRPNKITVNACFVLRITYLFMIKLHEGIISSKYALFAIVVVFEFRICFR